VHTDKKDGYRDDEALPDVDAAAQEETMRWLLDLDRSEPEDKLFTLNDDGAAGLELTDYERAVAHRPLSRGRAGADDISSYVEEEIVISSDVQSGSDIYGGADSPSVDQGDAEATGEVMAIDYSLETGDLRSTGAGAWDGADLLGLSEHDDIGEKFLVIKRVKTAPARPAGGDAGDGAGEHRADRVEPSAEVPAGPAPVADGAHRGEPPALRLVPTEETATADTEATEAYGVDNLEGAAAPDAAPLPALDLGEDIDSLFGEFGGAPAAAAGVEAEELQLPEEAGVFGEDIFAGDFTAAIGSGAGPAVDTGAPDEEIAAFFDDFTGAPGEAGVGGENVPAVARLEFTPTSDVLPDGADLEWEPDLQLEAGSAPEFMDFGTEADDARPELFDFESVAPDEAASGPELFDFEMAPPEEAMPVEAGLEFEAESLFDVGFDFPEPEGFDADLPEYPAQDPLPEAVAAGADLDWHEEATAPGAAEVEALQEAAAAEVEEIPVPVVEEPPAAVGEVPSEPLLAAGERWYLPAGVAFNHTSRGSTEIFADFLDAFIEEGSTELEKLEDAIARWEKEPGSDAAFAPVARTLHTLKGIAKGVGLQFYGTLIHNFETLLEALPKPVAGDASDYFRIVNVWLDAAVRGLDHVQQQRVDVLSEFPQPAGAVAGEATALPVEPESVASSATAAEECDEADPVPVPQEPAAASADAGRKKIARDLADEGARVLAAQQSVRITSDKLDHLLNLANQARQLGVRTAQGSGRNRRTAEEMQGRLLSVRNQIAGIADRALRTVTARGSQAASELDALEMDQYSELQEAANILREGVEDLTDLVDSLGRQNAQVEALLKQQANVISSIGSAIRAARVVPVSRLGPGLRRLVRTLSADLDKAVNLQVLNEVGTLDRDDFARCQTILDHMVRNALDHGIESAAEREAAGKPAAGRVSLDIRQVGADALITLADDGRGIDPGKMREAARRKGLDLDPDALSDEEAVRLIFHKGFSTARTLSEISGRGVGMDIVVSELQQMGGDIRISSRVGEGTVFHIRIPSTVTVNGALLVSVGEQSYAIPLGGVIAVDNVQVEDFFAAVEQRAGLKVAGIDCEPAYLGTLCQGDSLPDRKSWNGSVPVLVAGSPERRMAIAVDDVEEVLELVIRSLGVQFASVPGVAGAATTADGRAIVALDLNLLVSTVDVGEHAPVYLDAERPDTLLALVVDDSRTQRMVTTSQLETVGVETMTAEHGGVAIDLLNTAERLPDVVLLDVEMPVKDGIQTLREIRKSVRYGHIPVIMITSRTGLKHRSMAEAAGCNGYMGKPFNFRMLVAQISELTGHELRLS